MGALTAAMATACDAGPAVTDLPSPALSPVFDSPEPQVVFPSPQQVRPPQTPPAGQPAPD